MFCKPFAHFSLLFFFGIFALCSWQGQSSFGIFFPSFGSYKDTGKLSVKMDERFKIEVSADGKERQFPFIYKFGNDIFISYSEHKDEVMHSPVDAMLVSHDNGKSWSKKITNSDFYITSMVEKDGILYGVVYFTYPSSAKKEQMIYWTSSDHGNTWMKHTGSVHSGNDFRFTNLNEKWGNLLFHRGMIVMKDGSLEGVMYGRIRNEKKYTCVWVKSTDNCKNWKIVSVIAAGVPTGFDSAEGYCEPTFSKCADGSILCVMRIGSYEPLFQSRSVDNGQTWTTPEELLGLKPDNTQSVCPELLLMKNNVLALTYGRPGDKLAVSADGSGYKWDISIHTYDGETTGYSGIVEVDNNKLLLVSDQGRTGAKEPAIWGRHIEVTHLKQQ